MEVIIKPTDACNATCTYCSASAVTKGGKFMAKEQLGTIFEAFVPWLAEDPRRYVNFVWHGGEPLLAGPDFYRAVLAEQRRAFGKDLPRIRNSMQSNLTLVTERWIPTLKELLPERSIGTSFDLVPGVRDLIGGRSGVKPWLQAVGLLQRHGFRVGSVYVVHKGSLPLANELYSFFKNALRHFRIRVNPLYPAGRGGESESEDLWITDTEYGEFLLTMVERWYSDRCVYPVMPVHEWYQAWMGTGKGICCDSGGRCQDTHLGIASDGSVSGCGRSGDTKSMKLGNIFTDDLLSMVTRGPRADLAGRKETLHEGTCGTCEYWNACKGGCPVIAWHYSGSQMTKTYYCKSRKMVYGRFEELFGRPVWARPEAFVPSPRRLPVLHDGHHVDY